MASFGISWVGHVKVLLGPTLRRISNHNGSLDDYQRGEVIQMLL